MIRCLYVFICFAILMSVGACNKEISCLQYATISAKINFQTTTDSAKVKDTLLVNPLLVTDSFYQVARNIRGMSLLLNSHADSMQFLVCADSATLFFDTVQIKYNRTPNFVSKECGYNYFYTITGVTFTTYQLKKVVLINPLINDDNNVRHFQFFY
jgi:Family of unknown function (DUF6452)